jgi:Putative glycosyl hydrolase domain
MAGNPAADPYDIICLTLNRARKRADVSSIHFRSWLQAFRDHTFDRREFCAEQISDEILATEEFGSGG